MTAMKREDRRYGQTTKGFENEATRTRDEARKEPWRADGAESVNSPGWGNPLGSSILQRHRQGTITVLKGRGKDGAISRSETMTVWTKARAV